MKTRLTGRVFLSGIGGLIYLAFSICVQSSLFAEEASVTASPQELAAPVPFVGCRSDGQVGPVQAPTGKNLVLPLRPDTAQRLAYYKSDQGLGVLAPRGWYCFGTYGSKGEVLYVSPQPMKTANVFSSRSRGFAGPAIEVARIYGETSGRFGVARIIARIFPDHRAFVNNVIEEGMEPASSFPFGPHPKDRLSYKSKTIVEYETPAQTDGLGTNSRLQKSASPISGVAILVGPTPHLLFLSLRLPHNLNKLTPAIIQQVEREAVLGHQAGR